ncbi:hypothetical protein COOONC_22361 [Cooperia oncophora]
MVTVDLHTPGAGFFDTHVTWEDIEEDMRRELGTTASFGPNNSVRVMGDGKGFMSRLLSSKPIGSLKMRNCQINFFSRIINVSEPLINGFNERFLALDKEDLGDERFFGSGNDKQTPALRLDELSLWLWILSLMFFTFRKTLAW